MNLSFVVSAMGYRIATSVPAMKTVQIQCITRIVRKGLAVLCPESGQPPHLNRKGISALGGSPDA
jgi:hypothetical protein